MRFLIPARFLLAAFLMFALLVSQRAFAQIPRTLSYQAVLTDNDGIPRPDGVYTITFRLYTAVNGGVALWTEAQSLQVKHGLFSAVLGSVTPLGANLTFAQPYWLSLQISPDPELSSRLPLTSVGYSLNSLLANGTVVKSLNGLKDSVTLTAGSNVTITPSGNTLTLSAAGVGGSGIWSVNANNAYYNAGNVGIGTASPTTKLTVTSLGYGIEHNDGTRRLSSYLSASGGWFGTRSNDPLNFFVNDGAARMTLDIAGRVGIGTTTPASKLTIRTAGGFDAYGIEHTDGTVRLSTILDGAGGWLGTRTAHPLNFYVNDGLPSIAIDVSGNIVMTPNGGTGGYGSTTFGTPNGESGMSIRGGNRADVRFDGSTLKLVAGPGTGPPGSTSGIAVSTGGNVGIGITTPTEKLDVAGNVHVGGNVGVDGSAYISGGAVQNRDQSGFAKAMVYVHSTGAILRSYNPFATTTIQHIGVGDFIVDFGFQVDDRFYSVETPSRVNGGSNAPVGVTFRNQSPTALEISLFEIADTDSEIDWPFMIVVY